MYLAAILNPVEPVYQFDEKDWNTYSIEQVEKLGNKVDGGQAYRASKTLAERAAWKFIEEHTVNGVASSVLNLLYSLSRLSAFFKI